jgi:hypothetical protein
VTAAGGVEHLLSPAKTVDRVGDKAPVPGLASALDLPLAATVGGFRKDAAIGRRESRIAEQPSRRGRRPVGQVDRGRGRPLAAEQLGDRRDDLADAADRRVAVLGVADRRAENLGERHRPVIAQEAHPGAERRGNGGGEEPGARDQIETELAELGDRRGGGRHALTADDLATAVRLAPHEDRGLAERTVQMRLDDLQRESGGRHGVERITALFQHAHADGGSDPVGRGDDPEGAADLGPGGKGRHCVSPKGFAMLLQAGMRVK